MDTELYDRELDRIKNATLDSGFTPDHVDSEVMMRTLYESAFGIHNHYAAGQHPFARVAAYPKEDYGPYSSRYRDYASFVDERIYEATGIPMDRFFDRPRREIEMILGMTRVRNKKQTATADEVAAAAARATAAQAGKK